MKNTGSAGLLLSFIERVERLEEEKRALAEDIAEIKREAKSLGFDVKVINQMIRERRMASDDRAEFAALCETYRAALGMLDGTPLGEAARKRLSEPKPPPEDAAPSPPGEASGDDDLLSPTAAAADAPSDADIAAARDAGVIAHKAGVKVIENPWPAGDPRRSAWDEGWCSAAGSDGMDIPDAWRRKAKKKGGPKGGGAE